MFWPDVTFAYALFKGFPGVGYNPPCGVFGSQPAKVVSIDYVLAQGMLDATKMLGALKPSSGTFQVPQDDGTFKTILHDEHLLQAELADEK